MTYGYCKCSANNDRQAIKRQSDALRESGAESVTFEFGCDDASHDLAVNNFFSSRASGDTIIVECVSHIASSQKQFLSLIDTVKEKRLKLVLLNENITIDCTAEELDPKTEMYLRAADIFAEL